MSSDDGGHAGQRLVRARAPQDDLEGRRIRASVEARLFGQATDPVRIDRYAILDRVGAGGVGIVYAAHDPELDRKVALKVLHPQGSHGSTSSVDARIRLRREAQAMAQLSHPNVITVYEVGEIDDEVYIAMEFVEGEDLASWLRRGPHPWRDTVGRFVQAGRGLAAAHRAGLVHRDFKPSNVLAASDGRVRVLDFGLAKSARSDEPHAPSGPPDDSQLRGSVLTGPGFVLGTPAYMAPEQHGGGMVDARSDQFSFCVALFEGLYGTRPFEARDFEALVSAKQNGAVRFPDDPRKPRIPRRIVRAVLKGMSPDPADRHPSMDALVGLLEHDPRTSRRWGGLALVLVGLTATTTLWARDEQTARRCDDPHDRLHGIWDAEQKERIRTRFEGTGTRYGGATFERVEEALDAYVAQWSTARTTVCEAALRDHAAEPVGPQVCLDSRLRDLAQLTELLATADSTIVQNAVDASEALPSVEDCDRAEPSALGPQERARLADLEQRLTRARTLRAAGKFAEARDVANELRDAVRAEGTESLARQVMLLQSRLHDEMGDASASERALLETLAAAEAAGDDHVTIEAMIELVFVLGVSKSDPEAGLRWATFAEARIGRSGTKAQESQLLNHRGILLKEVRRYDEALATAQRALALRQELGEPAAIASSSNNLGIVQLERGDLAGAQASFEQACDLVIRTLGPDHPDVARPLANLASVYMRLEDWSRAEEKFLRARELIESTFGRSHPSMAMSFNNLGAVYHAQHRLEDALSEFEAADEVARATMGEDHPLVGTARVSGAAILAELGRDEEAEVRYADGIALLERALGPEHPRVVEARSGWAAIHQDVTRAR